jgi:hypothetical protein
MKKIKIRISGDGTQSIEVLGTRGDECVEFTTKLERRLGTPQGERTFKAEFDLDVSEAAQDDPESGT